MLSFQFIDNILWCAEVFNFDGNEVTQLCLTLCDPMDYSPPGSSVHGILQARILEWVPFPPGDLPDPGIKPRYPALQADALTSEPPGKPRPTYLYLLLLFTLLTLYLRIHCQTQSQEDLPLFSYKSFMVLALLFGEGNGTPLQYSCLENPMDGGAW